MAIYIHLFLLKITCYYRVCVCVECLKQNYLRYLSIMTKSVIPIEGTELHLATHIILWLLLCGPVHNQPPSSELASISCAHCGGGVLAPGKLFPLSPHLELLSQRLSHLSFIRFCLPHHSMR